MKKFILSACALFGLLATAAAQSDTVNVKLLERQPNPTLFSGLSSMVPGLRYAPTSDATGDYWDSMTIRGWSHLFSSYNEIEINRPSIYVDGMPFYGSLNSLNATDIEKIEVMKNATAIYGIDGANGVICITTKKGNRNRPVSVSFNGYASVSGWSRKPDMPPVDESRMTVVSQQAKQQGIWTDWMDEVSRRAIGQHYDLAVSGGAKIFDYYVSGNYDRRQGVLLGNDAEHLDLLAKFNVNPFPWMTFGASIQHAVDKDWGVPANINAAYWLSPYSYTHSTVPGYESWPNLSPTGNDPNPLWEGRKQFKYGFLFASTLWSDVMKKTNRTNYQADLMIGIPFVPGLQFALSGQHLRWNQPLRSDLGQEYFVNTNNPDAMDHPDWNASRAYTYTEDTEKTVSRLHPSLSWKRSFHDHLLTVGTGLWYSKTNNDGEFHYKERGGAYAFKYNKTAFRLLSFYGSLTYQFKDRVDVTVVYRRDHYKEIQEEDKNITYLQEPYSVGMNSFGVNASWRALKGLKLRASYDSNASTLYLGYPGDPFAKTQNFDFGADFHTNSGRLGITTDIYRNKTADQIIWLAVPSPTHVGFIEQPETLSVYNVGWEWMIYGNPVEGDGKDSFRWDTQMTFDLNRNRLDIENETNTPGLANALSYGFESYAASRDGDAVNSAYVINNHTTEYLGTTTPLFTVNFANTLSWKGVSLYFNFRWMQGNDGHFLGYNPNSANNPQYPYPEPYWQPRTFLKLKDLVLSYDLPLQVSWLRGASVYLSGTDLFTLTNWDGFDPENASGIPFHPISSRSLPYGTFRTIALGINLQL